MATVAVSKGIGMKTPLPSAAVYSRFMSQTAGSGTTGQTPPPETRPAVRKN